MRKTNEKTMDTAVQILLSIHKGDQRSVKRLCTQNVMWRCGGCYGSGAEDNTAIRIVTDLIAPETVKRFVRYGQYVKHLHGTGRIVAGRYQIEYASGMSVRTKGFEYTMVLADGIAEFIQIDFQYIPVRVYQITAVNEAVYCLNEREVLYVEAVNDRILWHCQSRVVEAVDTLKRLEQELSEEFVRVHRSYIVNKNRIRSIQRCSVTMSNDCNIPIPYKKYVSVREKLMCHSPSRTGH
ncbi:MAG: LytTR family transcriptional regulator DNA-binding domain-containing protein [Lachnospiraceae bacterium]|nr:LytTR family transcriptional regulator DNA-binding domain-containing protein [Lachnospiraceae bacterium]